LFIAPFHVKIDDRAPSPPWAGKAAMSSPVSRFAIGFAISALASHQALAQCPAPAALTSGTSVAVTPSLTQFSVTPPNGAFWSAVGIRQADGLDWNIDVRDETAAFPTCYSSPPIVLSNQPSGIDFAMTDWRFRPSGTDFVLATTAGPSGTAARIQFDQVFYSDSPNQPFNHLFVVANDVLKTQETPLQAGIRYLFDIRPSAGLDGLRFYLFAPVTSGSGWVSRGGRVLEQALISGTTNLIEYTPSVDGVFGIVVTNESALAGDFWITVKRCPFSASPLTDNFPRFSGSLDEWPGFTPPAPRWGVIGVRGELGSSFNLDVAPGFRAQDGSIPTCTDSVLAEQSSGLGARIIAGDFRWLPLRFYTAHMNREGQPTSLSQGYIEWEDGQDSLIVNAPATIVVPPAHNIIDAWGVWMIQGGSYQFQLTPNGGGTASYKMMIFGNTFPEGTPYWATRPEALGESASAIGVGPGQTGLYSVVVVNDNGGTGGYSIQVTSTLTDAPGPPATPRVSRILALTPNPSLGPTRIDYELARAGRAGVRVTDVAGRIIANLPVPPGQLGPGRLTWDGRAGDGTRPAAGLYFLALWVDGVAQGGGKMIIVH
jgi:hypothetical protein